MLRNICEGTAELGMKASKELHGASTQGIGLKPILNGCWLRQAVLLLQKLLALCYREPTKNNPHTTSIPHPNRMIMAECTEMFWRTNLCCLVFSALVCFLAYHVMAAAPQKVTVTPNFTRSFFQQLLSLSHPPPRPLQIPLGLTRWFLRSCFPLSDVSRKENQLRITSSSRISSW